MASPQTVQMIKELHAMADPNNVNDEKDIGSVMEAQYNYYVGLKQLAQEDPELEQRIPEYLHNNFQIANDASSMGIKGGKLKSFLDERGEETLAQVAQEADAKKIQQMQMEQQHQAQQQMMAQMPQQMQQGQIG